jgi:glycosyltransferase involved in cell wall biosynthesis
MGKPIIAPDNGPVRDVMDPELDGFLVKALRTDLVAILNFINNQPEEAHKRAQHFRQKILDTYTWKNQASFILNDFN